ncbi:hypothetical protein TNCV_3946641 [Trichonephila clavipes]|nr:hypothetical protein TNCV_3946641 [Trichonephila clavipes]
MKNKLWLGPSPKVVSSVDPVPRQSEINGGVKGAHKETIRKVTGDFGDSNKKTLWVSRTSVFVGSPSHILAANDLNGEECRPVVIKTYPQCQYDRAIYSPPDVELGTASELGSDASVYCLQAPMEWV